LIGIAIVVYPIILLLKIFGVVAKDWSWWVMLAPFWVPMIFITIAMIGLFMVYGTLIAIGA
jgi:hypothetical protein